MLPSEAKSWSNLGAWTPNAFPGDRQPALFNRLGVYAGLPTGSGQTVTLPGAVIFELEGDRIRREAHYYDAYTLLVQLGVLPAPGMEATPAA